jgi:hypothetical protein
MSHATESAIESGFQAQDVSKAPNSGSVFAVAQPRYETVCLVIASLLATIPVWLACYPPMADLPQHAAQVATLRNLHDPNFRFAELFEINWFTPYLVGYMAVYALAPLFGIVAACKIVVSAALAGIPLSTSLLLRENGTERYWALLTIPAMYGFTYEWGFLNFLVAAPVGLVFLAFVMRYVRKPNGVNLIWLGLFSILLFFCHALICGFFGLIACIYILAEVRSPRKALLLVAPMASAIPCIVGWYLRTRSHPTAHEATVWDLGWVHAVDPYSLGGRITGFFPRLLGMRANPVCILTGVSLFAIPLLAGARFGKRMALWVPFAVCVLALLFFPTTTFGTALIAQRFTVFSLPLFLLGINGRIKRPAWLGVAVILIAGWMVLLAARTMRYDSDARAFDGILERMEPNQRALSLMMIPDSSTIPSPVFLHFPAWYAAQREGVVDVNFALFYPELVIYKESKIPSAQVGFEWSPGDFTWDEQKGELYRYFVVHAHSDVQSDLFDDAGCDVTLAARSGDWWLYEKDPRCPGPKDQQVK